MNAYSDILAASDTDRRGLFFTAAERLGTTIQNIEKDFWVCWTLTALFHGLPDDAPRLLFKGGTSLSKGYGLITRFSEDIDITVFRDDIGVTASAEDLEAKTKTGRRKQLDRIQRSCQDYINGPLLKALGGLAADAMSAAGRHAGQMTVVPDREDADKQSLLIHYPGVTEHDGYIQPFIKIESGAKSALDPHEQRRIAPYIADDVPDGAALTVGGVTTIDPQRTLLDKILILHGLPIFFQKHGRLYGSGQVSRHYYDVHCLVDGGVAEKACTDTVLVDDCIKHAQMFFYRKDTGLDEVARGRFRLMPADGMTDLLRRDYEAMARMIFGEVPAFESVLASAAKAEAWLNEA
jgi:hypothetical protein